MMVSWWLVRDFYGGHAGQFRLKWPVWVQLAIILIGIILLFRMKRADLVAPFIAFIVGIHFFWLVDVFNDPSLYVLGILIAIIAVLSLPIAKRLEVANSAIIGIGVGSILLLFSLFALVRFLLA